MLALGLLSLRPSEQSCNLSKDIFAVAFAVVAFAVAEPLSFTFSCLAISGKVWTSTYEASTVGALACSLSVALSLSFQGIYLP